MIANSRKQTFHAQRATFNAQITEVVEALAAANTYVSTVALDSESFRELIQAPLQRYCPLWHKWRGSQVVRSRSAKPLFAGSIPAPAFFRRSDEVDNVAFVPRAGSMIRFLPKAHPS